MSDIDARLVAKRTYAFVLRYLPRRRPLASILGTHLVNRVLRRRRVARHAISIDGCNAAVAEAHADPIAEIHRVDPSEQRPQFLCLVSHDAVTIR